MARMAFKVRSRSAMLFGWRGSESGEGSESVAGQ